MDKPFDKVIRQLDEIDAKLKSMPRGATIGEFTAVLASVTAFVVLGTLAFVLWT